MLHPKHLSASVLQLCVLVVWKFLRVDVGLGLGGVGAGDGMREPWCLRSAKARCILQGVTRSQTRSCVMDWRLHPSLACMPGLGVWPTWGARTGALAVATDGLDDAWAQ